MPNHGPILYNIEKIYGPDGEDLLANLGGDAENSFDNEWYVDSVNGNDGYTGKSPDQAFASLTKVKSACAVGDTVHVAPNFALTCSSAGAFDWDKAGVKIIFYGSGSERGVITFDTSTSASFDVSANDVTILNLVGLAGLDGLTKPFNITGNNFTGYIEWQDASSTVEAATALRLDTADNFNVKFVYKGFPAGNATVRAIAIDDCDNGRLDVDFYGIVTTAAVNMVDVASTNIRVTGTIYTSGTTDFSKTVVDTITGSTWSADFFDAAAGLPVAGGSGSALATTVVAANTVPSADAVTNTNQRDVVGNKTDAGVVAVGTTKSLVAYAKGAITNTIVPSADTTNNIAVNDVVGNKTDAAVYTPGTTKSLMAHVKGAVDVVEKCVATSAATMVTGATKFTVAGGPIEIVSLVSVCVTGNDGTASTLQWSCDGTDGAATTFTGASASLANALAGASVVVQGTTLATAPVVNAAGAGISAMGSVGIIVPAGIITHTIGVGSTTGTWKHYLRYKPLGPGVTVV